MRTASPPLSAHPHAPELGLMRRLLGPLHVTGVFWYRFHRWGVSILPGWGVTLFTVVFTTFFFVALRRIRAAIASNLNAVLGPCGFWERQRRIYRTMWVFAWCLSERYERLSLGRRGSATIEGAEVWREALASPEGFVLITAHVGHWEIGAMMAPSDNARHVHVVREEEMDKRAQEFVRKLVATQVEQGLTMHFESHDPSLGTRLVKALRTGDVVAVQGDRPRAVARSVGATLFGRPIELPAGPAALARAAGVAMIPVFVFRDGRHHSRVVFRPPIRVDDEDRDLSRAVGQIAREIEAAIRRDPYQWFCFRELWPKKEPA